jgi:stage II sporulation protein AA (anti-sigma F factor antagonist)
MNDRANGHRTGRGGDGGSTLVVTRTDTSDGVCLTATGEIDQASAPILVDQLHSAIDNRDGLIVLDLGDVTFMDSSGVNALVAALHSARSRLRLGTLHPAVRQVLEITALLDVFAFADDLPTGTASDAPRDKRPNLALPPRSGR